MLMNFASISVGGTPRPMFEELSGGETLWIRGTFRPGPSASESALKTVFLLMVQFVDPQQLICVEYCPVS